MVKYLFTIAACLLIVGGAFAQSDKLGYGFRAGVSISKFDGPSELGPDGASLESFSMARGFHLGAALSYKMTDLFGFRTELVFSQRGTIYDFNGPSYYLLGKNNLVTTTIQGNRKQTLNLSCAYLDIPIMVYYKFGSFEIAGGLNSGMLMASTAGGSIDFDGISALGTTIAPFEVGLNHNYKKDEAGEGSSTTIDVVVDGRIYKVAETVGAYYDFTTKDKDLYETFDFGLVGVASFFLNEGLYVSARYVHGLGDVDRNEYDISLQSQNNGSSIPRTDKNSSRSWQFSIGFSF